MKRMLDKIENQLLNYSYKNLRTKRWIQKGIHEHLMATHNRLTPSTYDYFFELNPSFVYQYHDLENLAEYPVVMFRDGYLGIFYFFAKFPKPLKGMETILLVPKKFSSLVSKFWEGNVLFYSINNIATNNQKREPIKQVYIYGAPTVDNFINKTISECVEEIKYLIPKGAKVSILSTVKHQYFFDFRNEIDTAMEFRKEVFQKLGFDVEFIDEYKKELFENAGPHCGFIDLDTDNFIIHDHFFKHFFSSRGAVNMRPDKPSERGLVKSIKLSLNHEINIEKSDENAFDFDILREKINLRVDSIPLIYQHFDFYTHVKELFKEGYKPLKQIDYLN